MSLLPRRLAFAILASSALVPLAAAPASTQAQTQSPAGSSVPIPDLVKQVSIPHTKFKLKNGLTVIVHEDRKAPIVAVSMWYNVGAKDEPKGKTGFAHLFEHLMFNGSENMPGEYFNYLQELGATDYNGTTNNDRTNYFQTVPAGALERALFMESDRMGWLLGAVTQGVLDNQRAVVQNEKRQGDSRPGGLVQYALFEGLFPPGHPYHHTVIGSMADLDSASLADVKDWFRAKYGPNNAVLVIAGDVSAGEARPLVEKYFGPIPAGPVNRPAMATVPALAKAKTVEMKDAVATTIIQRYWPVPGLLDKQLAALDVGGSVLGGLASSRLDNILVRDEQLAVAVTAGLTPLQRAGIFSVSAYVTPGVDPAKVAKRLDEIVADYIAKGPTADEVQRAVMSQVSSQIRELEQVGGFGGKAVSLAQGQTFAGDSDLYKKTLATYAAVAPAVVKSAMQRWLTRPALTIVLAPGERNSQYSEAKAVEPKKDVAKPAVARTRTPPPISDAAGLDLPDIVHSRLSNGIEIDFAQQTGLPITQIALSFDAGAAADAVTGRGLSGMTIDLLDEGTSTLTGQQFAEARERLGATISTSGSLDRSYVYLSALTPNLAPSLDLMQQTTLDPAFREEDIARLKSQRLTAIAQSQKDPTKAGQRLLPSVLYGASHPYGGPPSGDSRAVAGFTRADFVAFRDSWLRPDNVKILVVSDRPLSEIQPLLESRFGKWSPPSAAKGQKAFSALATRPSSPKVLLVNRPGAPQAGIIGAQLLPIPPKGDIVPFSTANDILSGDFTARLNMNLREDKGWSYGVSGSVSAVENAVQYVISAPVQVDRTGDSIAALSQDVSEFLTTKGVTQEERDRTIANNIKQLPGQFETSGALLGAMINIDLLDRPDNYYETLEGKYRSLTAGALDAAARAALDPKGFVWIVTGNAAKIRPQLEKLGIPVEVVEAP